MNIQALFEGTIDDFPSTSPAVPQRIDKFTTATGLTFATQLQPNGQMRDILEADVIAIGGAGISPVGQVVFRRNGRTIGRARLNNGSALLILGRRIPARGKFVAALQGGSEFNTSRSAPLRIP